MGIPIPNDIIALTIGNNRQYFGDFLCSMTMEALVWRSPVLGENSQASLREATRTDQIMTAFNFFVHMMTASNFKPNLSLNPKNCVTKISWL